MLLHLVPVGEVCNIPLSVGATPETCLVLRETWYTTPIPECTQITEIDIVILGLQERLVMFVRSHLKDGMFTEVMGICFHHHNSNLNLYLMVERYAEKLDAVL